jgi:hypothetical protein
MRYTAFAVIMLGVVAGCFAGYQYASGGSPEVGEKPSTGHMVIPLLFAVLLVVGGVWLWVFPRVGYTGTKGTPVSPSVRHEQSRR